MEFLTIAIVADDSSFLSSSTELPNHLKKKLATNFDLKLFGRLESFIGWNIHQTDDGISSNQHGYILQMLNIYRIGNANSVKTPQPLKGD